MAGIAELTQNAKIQTAQPSCSTRKENTTLIAVFTPPQQTCIAIITDESKVTSFLASPFPDIFKSYQLFQLTDGKKINGLFCFLQDLFEKHSESFAGFYTQHGMLLSTEENPNTDENISSLEETFSKLKVVNPD
jgi:hypothetical protein